LNLQLIEAQADMTNEELEERRDALARCIKNLRERDRDLVAECYGDASGIHTAADRRGRSPQSIYNSLRRIRRALFECITRTLSKDAKAGWIQ